MKVPDSKLSLIRPVLKEKSLLTLSGGQLRTDETSKKSPVSAEPERITETLISEVLPDSRMPDFTLGSEIVRLSE